MADVHSSAALEAQRPPKSGGVRCAQREDMKTMRALASRMKGRKACTMMRGTKVLVSNVWRTAATSCVSSGADAALSMVLTSTVKGRCVCGG